MKCVLCKHGDTKAGKVTVTLQRGNCTIIIKDVPGEVCVNCSEYYLSDSITKQILALAEDAALKGIEVEILRFAA